MNYTGKFSFQIKLGLI